MEKQFDFIVLSSRHWTPSWSHLLPLFQLGGWDQWNSFGWLAVFKSHWGNSRNIFSWCSCCSLIGNCCCYQCKGSTELAFDVCGAPCSQRSSHNLGARGWHRHSLPYTAACMSAVPSGLGLLGQVLVASHLMYAHTQEHTTVIIRLQTLMILMIILKYLVNLPVDFRGIFLVLLQALARFKTWSESNFAYIFVCSKEMIIVWSWWYSIFVSIR